MLLHFSTAILSKTTLVDDPNLIESFFLYFFIKFIYFKITIEIYSLVALSNLCLH